MTRDEVLAVARKRRRRPRNPILLGYCGRCGKDVETDFCYQCQRYVQPSPNDKKRRTAMGQDAKGGKG